MSAADGTLGTLAEGVKPPQRKTWMAGDWQGRRAEPVLPSAFPHVRTHFAGGSFAGSIVPPAPKNFPSRVLERYPPWFPMRLSDLFSAEDVVIDFAPADKWDAIQKLVGHLVQRGRLPAAAQGAIVEAVLARERSMSTGMEHGIAIPHAAVDGVETVLACMGIVSNPSGLSFESIDGRPTRIV